MLNLFSKPETLIEKIQNFGQKNIFDTVPTVITNEENISLFTNAQTIKKEHLTQELNSIHEQHFSSINNYLFNKQVTTDNIDTLTLFTQVYLSNQVILIDKLLDIYSLIDSNPIKNYSTEKTYYSFSSAVILNKPLYIYATNLKQWCKYNYSEKYLTLCPKPELTNKTLVLGNIKEYYEQIK